MKVLLPGASGTFGQAFLRRTLSPSSPHGVSRLAAFARSESRLAILAASFADAPAFRGFLGDIRDRERLLEACEGIDVIVHAAALKRVDDGAYNPSEMIQTNIIGTQNVIRAGLQRGVSKIVVVSSDKAVAPINVYGGTKFVGEQFAVAFNSISVPQGTRVACVRYGNVLGSTGSVLTLWNRQRDSGTLRITDRSMTRFWMSVDDAVDLVMATIHNMQGGEIFIPALRSSSVEALAHAFAPECDLLETGIRVGGEKLHERLLTEDESRRVVSNMGMLVVPPATVGLDSHWTTHRWSSDGSVDIPNPYGSDFGGIGQPYTLSDLHDFLVRVTAAPYV